MTTKPKARKYRIRRGPETATVARPLTEAAPAPLDAVGTAERPAQAASGGGGVSTFGRGTSAGGAGGGGGVSAMTGQVDSPAAVESETSIDAIRREGLTGRQLRMARRVAAKQGLDVTSDFDAVYQLRKMGVDPFQRSSVLELVVPDSAPAQAAAEGGGGSGGRTQLPQTIPVPNRGGSLPVAAQTAQVPSTELRQPSPVDQGMAEVAQIQKDLARRRQLKFLLTMVRLALFVGLPTFAAGWYFYAVATPMYATKSEFVIQQADPQGSAGLGSLFQGTSMATQQDAIGVQSYLMSRDAMLRLDEEEGFRDHFSQEHIDPIQALPPESTREAAYGVFQDRVRVSYDPTEGLLRMEVVAADPDTSQRFSEALVTYAEQQVDRQTLRLREDQMQGARESYEAAESRRTAALSELLGLQEELETIDPAGETAARTQQIGVLQTRRQELAVELETRLAVRRPNAAQVEALQTQIGIIDAQIAGIQSDAVDSTDGASQAQKNTQLRLAEENYALQTLLVQQAVQAMETAQIEANRQVRYLSLTVAPVAPDEPTYPRAFENTILAFLVFSGIYLMVAITGSILREQMSS